MSKSRIVLDKLAKLLEQGIINYKDMSKEIFFFAKFEKRRIYS